MEKKGQVIKITVFITSLFIIFMSVSYAFINMTLNGEKKQILSAGNLDLVLDEDENNLVITNALPMYDEVGMIQDAFTFRLINQTGIQTSYVLKLEEIANDSPLAKENVKYGLTKDGISQVDLVSNIIGDVIDEGIISGNQTIEYELRLWIKDSVTDGSAIKGKSLSFRLGLTMSQTTEIVYQEEILNGAYPVLSDNLVPVKISDDGTVQKANIYDKWYSYEDKIWANAVVLKTEVEYIEGQVIPEENIESYFVWIPRYKYKIFNDTVYTGVTSLENRVQTIEVEFENKDTPVSTGSKVGEWLTHPAFTAFESNGLWVGKFESGYDSAVSEVTARVNSSDSEKIVIKPNIYSWRNITVGNAFKASYDYLRSDESHMMKNTEWGSVAYLQHSMYGSSVSVRNNNNAYKTGYASVQEPTLGYNTSGTSTPGNLNGTESNVTLPYNTEIGYTASTTGNISGIYDMSGGAWEYVMGYNVNASSIGGSSDLTTLYENFFSDSSWDKYYDKYYNEVNDNSKYQTGILGDATREMGSFGKVKDPDGTTRNRTSWYEDSALFVNLAHSWFERGGVWHGGVASGTFAFSGYTGGVNADISFRVVLTPTT